MRASQKSRAWFLLPFLITSFYLINPSAQAAYVFSTHTFTNCSASGKTGPTQAACRSAYSTTWDESDSNFTVTSGIQNWIVPTSGYYYIDAYGAGGYGAYAGGGARIADTFLLTEGEVIKILVGQVGETNTGVSANSGAGGTFVIKTPYNTNGSILVIAGGGGGSESGSSQRSEAHASITTSGNNGYTAGTPGTANTSGLGGTLGNGGGTASADNAGGGGGGFLSDGSRNSNWENNGGFAFVNGGTGATGGSSLTSNDGGFGGGGASAGKGGGGGAGGGGGYSGGGGGDNVANGAGGGGGSYFANGLNTNRITTINANPAQSAGYVTITFLSAAVTSTTLAIAGNASSAEYNKPISVTATVDSPGKVTFKENGRKIPNCVGKAATSTVTCNWLPKIRGNVLITASLVPTNVSLSGSTSSAIKLFITSRTSSR